MRALVNVSLYACAHVSVNNSFSEKHVRIAFPGKRSVMDETQIERERVTETKGERVLVNSLRTNVVFMQHLANFFFRWNFVRTNVNLLWKK